MKHYDQVEWTLYKEKLLSNKINEEMENHLYLCDECMKIFLSLIDEKEIHNTEKYISKDFTLDTMRNIRNLILLKRSRRKTTTKSINDFFLYYAAVASVAIVLTATGTFSRMINIVPDINNSIKINENKIQINRIYSLSENITNRTSEFISEFQIKK
ncbi:MAG: hypothetical protein M0Q14_04165 [Tissierellaceae bacterium]|nr:hypothetical protein [Tissierellaceae bacterium]